MNYVRAYPLIFACLLICAAASAEEGPHIQESPYGALEAIKGFARMRVELYGDAERNGLSEKELTEIVRMTFMKAFDGLGMLPLPAIPLDYTDEGQINAYTRELSTLGYLFVGVFVVGEDYPVAYQVEFRAGNCLHMDEFKKWALWEREALGFTSREELKDDVLRWLNELMALLSSDFFAARRE